MEPKESVARFQIVAALASFDDDGVGPLQRAIYAGGFFEHANAAISSQHIARFGAPACGITSYCFADGSLATGCPCDNNGATGRGCANSINAAGALLVASGSTAIDPMTGTDTIVLSGSGMPNIATTAAVFLQGSAISLAGPVFGDGLRCANGSLIRLGSKATTGGVAQYPEAGNLPVSQRGMVTSGSGSICHYQTYYRNSAAGFCPPATFNVTNALQIVW